MRQVGDTLVWLAMIGVVAAVVYFTPRLASYVGSGSDHTRNHDTSSEIAYHQDNASVQLPEKKTGLSPQVIHLASSERNRRIARTVDAIEAVAFAACHSASTTSVRPDASNRYGQLFRNAIASAVRLRMSSIWSVDWKPMMKALTVPSPST